MAQKVIIKWEEILKFKSAMSMITSVKYVRREKDGRLNNSIDGAIRNAITRRLTILGADTGRFRF